MKPQIVSFHCIVWNRVGRMISSTYNQDVITAPPGTKTPSKLRGLAESLQDIRKGQKRKIFLPADQAYGFYDPELVIELSRKAFPADAILKPGDPVRARSKDGEIGDFRILEVTGTSVTLDGNHPLAGQDLIFDIEATEVREATPEEIAESTEEPANELYH